MPHRAPIRRHSRLLQAVALALIVLTAAAAAWQFNAFLTSAERVKRSHEAMAAVSDTQSALYATESSARGYRIYKQAAMMSAMFSWPQLVTALIGGVLGTAVSIPVKRAMSGKK